MLSHRVRGALCAPLCWLILSIGGSLSAQVSWTYAQNERRPSARHHHAMASDVARGRIVLFGGDRGQISCAFLDDTWEWDGSDWTLMSTTVSPRGRSSHAMAFDAARRRTVLFGGSVGETACYAAEAVQDTWEWDGTTWVERFPATKPSARAAHAMAYDAARQRVVLFGGAAGGGGYRNDTWEWDGTDWIECFPAVSPMPRASHAMAYDAARGKVVLFGGYGGGQFLADTWEWDGASWVQRSPTQSPRYRAGHAMAYDAYRDRVVLTGGYFALPITPCPYVLLYDTWEWAENGVNGGTWTPRARIPLSSTASVSGYTFHAIAYDAAQQQILSFGYTAFTDSRCLVYALAGVTLEYTTNAPASYATFGQGCAGSAGVPELVVPPAERPWMGQPFGVRILNLPSPNAASMLIGASNATWGSFKLPFALAELGLPGCALLASAEIVVPVPGSGGEALWSVQIPDDVTFVGTSFYNQAVVLDALANPAGLVLSNGGRATIGQK